jgi:hypothetical protein
MYLSFYRFVVKKKGKTCPDITLNLTSLSFAGINQFGAGRSSDSTMTGSYKGIQTETGVQL